MILGAQLKDYHQGMVHYHLPESGQTWARIFGLMEGAKSKYQIEDYSVGQTTLEQVSDKPSIKLASKVQVFTTLFTLCLRC